MSFFRRYATAPLLVALSLAVGLAVWGTRLTLADPAAAVSLLLFLATGAGIWWLSHRLRQAESRERDAAGHHRARALELQTILDTAVDGIIVIDAQGRIESFNRGAEQLFGYPAAAVTGRNVSVLMPSPDRERHDDYLARFLSTGEARVIGQGRVVNGRRHDGSVFPLHLQVGEMVIGGTRKFTGVLHDLSARTQHEERRRASEARWQAVVESAVDGIVVIDQHGRVESFNPAAERLFGYAEAELIGQNVTRLMPSPYRDEHDAYLARYLATGTKKIIGLGREVQGLRRDGSTFPLHLSVGEVQVNGERRFTGILHDLTTRTEMEGKLREQTALARLGEMAAVVAHEVKNPLAGIRGAIQVIGGRLPADSTDRRMTGEIVSRIDALSALMRDLLLFARPPEPRPQLTDVAPFMAATAALLRQDPSLGEVNVHVDGQAPPVMADGSLLQIVFHNLLVNGAQAMQGRGDIRVSIGHAAAMCRIAITDRGPGIPADLRDKVFTPFFTTKARGSGLGLATCRRLVEAHRGTIVVDCPADGGTTVTISLPAAPARESPHG